MSVRLRDQPPPPVDEQRAAGAVRHLYVPLPVCAHLCCYCAFVTAGAISAPPAAPANPYSTARLMASWSL